MDPIRVSYINPFLPTPLTELGLYSRRVAQALDAIFLRQGMIAELPLSSFVEYGLQAGITGDKTLAGLAELNRQGLLRVDIDGNKITPDNWQPERFRPTNSN